MSVWAKVGVLLVAILLGFGIGYWVKGSVVARQTVVTQTKTITVKDQQAEQRAKDEGAAAATAKAELLAEQGKTADLNAQLDDQRSKNASLQAQIDHGDIDAPIPTPVAGKCPGNPLAGDEFSRLYESAGTGQPAPRP